MAISLPTINLGGEPNNRIGATCNLQDFKVSGEYIDIPAFTWTITVGVYNTSAYVQAAYGISGSMITDIYINGLDTDYDMISCGIERSSISKSSGWSSASGTSLVSAQSKHFYSQRTSRFFNENNSTIRSVPLTMKRTLLTASNQVSGGSDFTTVNLSGSVNITLDAPPIFESEPNISKNTDNYYKDITTITINNSAIAQYGGYIISSVLTVGNQSKTIEGADNISLLLNQIGTFIPTLVITDSRGQVTKYTFESITVIEGIDTTFNSTQVSSDKNGFWTEKSTASVIVSNISVPYSGSVSEIEFTIGDQSVTRNSEGTLQIIPSREGMFVPTISVEDSFGRIYSQNLNAIEINTYQLPQISQLSVYRVTHDSKLDDEGTWAVIEIPIIYTYQIINLKKPIIKINNIDTETSKTEVGWYSSWNQTKGLTNEINWTNYNPTATSANPTFVYALVKREFNYNISYSITVQSKDGYDELSEPKYQTLAAAFFTIDILAGGHGITFGAPAKDIGFHVDMDTTLRREFYLQLDQDAASGSDYDLIYWCTQLGWDTDGTLVID